MNLRVPMVSLSGWRTQHFCFNWQNFFWACKPPDEACWNELQLDGKWGREGALHWKVWVVTEMASCHQRRVLPLQSVELLLRSGCPSIDYISQHALYLGRVMWLVLTNWMWVEVMCTTSNIKWIRSRCAFSTRIIPICNRSERTLRPKKRAEL